MNASTPAPDKEVRATPLPNSNDDERWREWWEGWRTADYSWDGLAAKPWSGWLWDTVAEQAVPAEGAERRGNRPGYGPLTVGAPRAGSRGGSSCRRASCAAG